MSEAYTNPAMRHDFVLVFDVHDGNPNGDPDAGNLPRVDPETMHGLVTDVCLKRKVRDYVALQRAGQPGYNIYVQHKGILYHQQAQAFQALGFQDSKEKDLSKIGQARAWMCRNFYDIRAFGAVMNTKEFKCGQVRGPLQLTFARSIDPIVPLSLSITRVAVTKPNEEKETKMDNSLNASIQRHIVSRPDEEEDEKEEKETEMGRKALLPYGLYRGYGFFNPHLAQDTGFTEADLALFWEALQKMWDLDRSASRGLMACQKLIVFTHDSPLGNAPAHKLFELVHIAKRPEVATPRHFSDYEVRVDKDNLPAGVSLHVLV